MSQFRSTTQTMLPSDGPRHIWSPTTPLSEPNSLLRACVESGTNLLDAITTDTLPSSQRVKKTGQLYDVHSYWSKKPYLAIQRFIDHYSRPGDLVLDPFCGGGSTLQAALALGRKAIGIDLSPAAAHISANIPTYVSPAAMAEVANELISALKATVVREWYTITHERSSLIASNFIHAEQVRCRKCLNMFSILEPHSSDARPACPDCGEAFSTRSRKTEFGADEIVAVEVRKTLESRRGKLLWLCDHPGLASQIRASEAKRAADVTRKLLSNQIPQRLLDLGGRLNTSGSTTLGTLHDDRSLIVLVAIKQLVEQISDPVLRGKCLLAFTAILKNCSKMYRFHEGGGGSAIGAYYVPPIRKELNPVFAFIEKLSAIKNSLDEIAEWPDISCIVSNQSAASLDIPSNSIDFVFTDPPYADTMPFGDLNCIWDGWLCPGGVGRTGEAIGTEWHSALQSVFSELHRVLKPGAFCAVCYHDTAEGTWADLLDIMAEAGFVGVFGKDVLYIETTQKAYQQTVADKVVKRDHVVVFRKPQAGEWKVTRIVGNNTFGEIATPVIRDFLTAHPGATKDRIYDELINRLARNRQLEAHDFEALLRTVAEEVKEPIKKNLFENKDADLFGGHVTSRWYLKDTADQIDPSEQKKEDAAAEKLEKFIAAYLKKHTVEEGVHYSDLFEHYLPVAEKPRRLLADWLPEYFFKTPSGTWRPPADKKEQEQKAALREAGTLRRMKRFANALIDGVPIRDQDRPANDRTLAEWIRQCRRAGLYEQGRALYEKGGLNTAALGEDEQVAVEDDYRLCVKRFTQGEEKPKAKRRKKSDDE